MDIEAVWVDEARCTGCGACVRVCPVGAISLVGGKARIDVETCTGCQTCVQACPEQAIRPVVQGELVQVAEKAPPARYQSRPLAQSVAAGVVVTGLGLLGKAVGALARVVGGWLAQMPSETSSERRTPTKGPGISRPVGGGGRGGRRARYRRRGG